MKRSYNINITNRRGKNLMGKLIIDGNAVYEIDEACVYRKKSEQRGQRIAFEPIEERRKHCSCHERYGARKGYRCRGW